MLFRSLKDKDFLMKNGGGITLSGGEPLAQPEFLIALLEKLSEVHTTLDTCGYAEEEIFLEAVKLVDLVLFDLKHTDLRIHKAFTGKDNALILSNLKRLGETGKALILRVPLIPGVNDDRKNLGETARIAGSLSSLIRVELLPYHPTAGVKYEPLGMEYNPGFKEEKRRSPGLEIFKEQGVPVEVI